MKFEIKICYMLIKYLLSVVGAGALHGCWLFHVQLRSRWRISLWSCKKNNPEVCPTSGTFTHKNDHTDCACHCSHSVNSPLIIPFCLLTGFCWDKGGTGFSSVWNRFNQKSFAQRWSVPEHHRPPPPHGGRLWTVGGNRKSNSPRESAGWLYPFKLLSSTT